MVGAGGHQHDGGIKINWFWFEKIGVFLYFSVGWRVLFVGFRYTFVLRWNFIVILQQQQAQQRLLYVLLVFVF